MSHVLIIDDDREILLAHRIALESQGHRVSQAESGEEGWRKIQSDAPDLVVLDCMMEEFTTGFTLAQDLSYYFPRLPVIMLSSVGEKLSSAWSFSETDRDWLPVHRFLPKPVAPRELLDAVSAMVH